MRAEAAFAMATELGLDELRAHALTTVGMAKNAESDGSGIPEMEQALEIALAADSPVAASITNNLAVFATFAGEFPRVAELYTEAARLAERYGDAASGRFIRGNRIWIDFILGHWERALEQADAFIAECESGSPHTNESLAREVRAGISRARGAGEEAIRHQLRAYELMIADRGPFHRIGALALLAATYAELGRDEAKDLAVQIPPLVRETGLHGGLIRLAPYADELGIGDGLRAAVAAGAGPRVPVWRRTIGLILGGELSAAADVMAAAGNVTAEANLRKLAGLRLASAGRSEEARADLERALAFYRAVGATAYVAEIEEALAGAQSESA